ncbi:TetR family transcriptional regulator [Capsulimonas corticalis]|uniref:TetR family transcriptional regulator n=1 Tax=Capsulimonas corticalis TaxID=2219043 RepID=A0A402CSN1_9BACT|nr:TetR/AcrR family transcriptional regulator [Capsulimonas corticalis]BDI31035.1 TetR family transcriptional regulator [Capsulimonas corticalis]
MSTLESPVKRVGAAERGRPREFDTSAVLAAAADAFWERGYHATSIDDLCKATGLLRGSLYAAFGDKRGILLAALDHYSDAAVARLAGRLSAAEPSRETLRAALMYYTRTAAIVNGQCGCLITNLATEMLPQDAEVAEKILRNQTRMAALLAGEVARGQKAGVFSNQMGEREASNFLLCIIQGLRVMGKVQHEEQNLRDVVEMTMRALA